MTGLVSEHEQALQQEYLDKISSEFKKKKEV